MSIEEPATTQVSWSPDELPAEAAKALQDKEEARAKRGARKAAAALTASPDSPTEEAPAKKRRTRTTKAKAPVAKTGENDKVGVPPSAADNGTPSQPEVAKPSKAKEQVPVVEKVENGPAPAASQPQQVVPPQN